MKVKNLINFLRERIGRESAGKFMNRNTFMKQLESLLQNVSEAERKEALEYYENYFDDAGAENEQEVLDTLGDPAVIADNIRRDLYGSGNTSFQYQNGASNTRAVVEYGQTIGAEVPKKEEKSDLPTWVIVLIVVLLVLTFPMWNGLAGGLFGTLLGLVISWFALILASGIVTASLLAVMAILIIVGIMCIPVSPLSGVALIGGGFVCGAVGILFLMLTVAMAGIATPAACKGIVLLCRKAFGKNK